MALGDRYFPYTKSVYNNFVVYPPLLPSSSGSLDPSETYLDESSSSNPNRGLPFALAVIAKASIKPFALAGALLGDLVADIIRIPVDLGRGITNPSQEASMSDSTTNKLNSTNTQALPSFFGDYVPPKNLRVDPQEARVLVGNSTTEEQASTSKSRIRSQL